MSAPLARILPSHSRRQFLLAGAPPLALLCPRLAVAQHEPVDFVEARTAAGRIRGFRRGGVCLFRGIPYAGSVSGPNRFKAAPPLQPWSGVRDAIEFGPPSWQPGQRRNEPPQDEDCLVLNI